MDLNSQELIFNSLNQPPRTDKLVHQINVVTNDGKQMILNTQLDTNAIHIDPYTRLHSNLENFLNGIEVKKWLLITGLRGVGKTTILKQLYHDSRIQKINKYYLSLDNVKIINGQIVDCIMALEQALGAKLENYNKPFILLLDEVQYLNNWSTGLKTIFDRAQRIFLIATGSSALSLHINPDIARRSTTITMHPLTYNNFAKIKYYQNESINLMENKIRQELKQIIFQSDSDKKAYSKLKNIAPTIDKFWNQSVLEEDIDDYISYGTLPYTHSIVSKT